MNEANINENIHSIIEYWFGDDAVDVVEGRDSLWFGGGDEIDEQIINRFSTLVHSAAQQQLDEWLSTAKGSLALILLLDQFTRNIYRSSAEAFASDYLARAICYQGLAQDFDQQLSSSERVFYYLPLEHSESITDQELSVQLYKKLASEVDTKYGGRHKKMFAFYIEYAELHHEIIDVYQRFPHRNALLGRESTQRELDYLKKGGHTFGQS